MAPCERRRCHSCPTQRPHDGRGSLGGGCDPRPGGENTTKKLIKHSPCETLASRSTLADIIPISGVRGISSPVQTLLRSAVLIRCGVLHSLTPLPSLLLSGRLIVALPAPLVRGCGRGGEPGRCVAPGRRVERSMGQIDIITPSAGAGVPTALA